MQQQHQKSTAIAAAVSSSISNSPTQPTLFTVEQFPTVEPSFTSASLRNLIFKAQPRRSSQGVVPGNGLLECGAIVRVGRKVLIHRAKFLEWVQL